MSANLNDRIKRPLARRSRSARSAVEPLDDAQSPRLAPRRYGVACRRHVRRFCSLPHGAARFGRSTRADAAGVARIFMTYPHTENRRCPICGHDMTPGDDGWWTCGNCGATMPPRRDLPFVDPT